MAIYEVWFEHCSGGDSLLPREDRGYFNDYSVEVEAESREQAEQKGMDAMHTHVSVEHPDWVLRAVDDLAATAELVK